MNGIKRRFLLALSLCLTVSVFAIFYYIYVPLIAKFQFVLIPLLLGVALITIKSVEWGLWTFIFLFPLINNLPFYFKIGNQIPHAPTALLLFIALFLGWLVNQILSPAQKIRQEPIFRPLLLLSSLILMSMLINLWKFTAFAPFLSSEYRELIVNVNGVRSGGAIMSGIFTGLNYLTGFLFYFILIQTFKTRDQIKKALTILAFSAFGSLLLSFIQIFVSIRIGNRPFWTNLGQINSTFKDPNSFGLHLAVIIPVFLGAALAYKTKNKPYFILVSALALLVFPQIGTRSALLGLFFGLFLFLFFVLKTARSPQKKLYWSAGIIAGCILILFFFLLSPTRSVLSKRIHLGFQNLTNQGSINQFTNRKIDVWRAAFEMTRDYPLTGVGIGGYIIDLPNYFRANNIDTQYTDSAENYGLQVTSELGIVGVALFLWLLFELLRLGKQSWRMHSRDKKQRFLLFGLYSAAAVFFTNYCFHSYIGNFETKYLFWLLVGLLTILPESRAPVLPANPLNLKFIRLAIFVVLFFSSVHLWNSIHSLSIHHRSETFQWNQEFGFYQNEKDNRGFRFRWTGKSAGMTTENLGEYLMVPILATHHNLTENPVEVRIYLADNYFNKIRELKSLTLAQRDWQDVEIKLRIPDHKIRLLFETSRTWQPSRVNNKNDTRHLGIAVGDPWFDYRVEPTQFGPTPSLTIPRREWKGKYGNILGANGESTLVFRNISNKFLITLLVRGDQAFRLGPLITIKIDGRTIAKTWIQNQKWAPIYLPASAEAGNHTLTVTFSNDLYHPGLKQNRNLYLGEATISESK